VAHNRLYLTAALVGLLAGPASAQILSAAHVKTEAALAAASTFYYPNGLWRDDFSPGFGAPPLWYSKSAGACSLNGGVGDGGSQVPSIDGNCWVASFNGPPDVREWGHTYPFVLHAVATGTDAGWCFVEHPCQTLQYASVQALRLYWNNQGTVGFPQVSLDGGTFFAGAMITGTPVANGSNQISGTYLVINGNGTATVTAATGQVFNIEASDGASVLIENFTCGVANGNYCTFAQNPGTTLQIGPGIVCTGAATANTCIYDEGLALIEASTGETLKIQGAFSYPILAGTNANIEFDPGTFTIDCGSGLTVTSFLEAAHGANIEYGPTAVNNCGSVTGDLLRGFDGGHFYFTAAPVIPGSLYTRLYDLASTVSYNGTSPWLPTLGTCANGALANGSNNYAISIAFSGANSSCAVLFGKASNATAYFASTPVCTGVSNTGGAGPSVSLASVSNLGFTIIPSSAWANGQTAYVLCSPLSGG
jgi:hypothetical protein